VNIPKLNAERVIALTATATPLVQDDICQLLGFKNPKKFIGGIYRNNLEIAVGWNYDVVPTIVGIAEGYKEGVTGIAYCPTRAMAEFVCEGLRDIGLDSTFYHAGMSGKRRKEVQDKWMNDGGVIVATCAFGMGIDRPDVRFVIHVGLPETIDSWYQEIGRAGRDGKDSVCVVLRHKGDYGTRKMFIDMSAPPSGDVERFLTKLKDFALPIAQPGAKTVTLNMTQKKMGEVTETRNYGGCVSFLYKRGVLRKIERGKYMLALEHPDINFAQLYELRRWKMEKLDSLNQMHLNNKECRFKALARYFGDSSFNGRCGKCDNCG